ncbi:ABC-three component system middle component 6 [Lactiplantibacillus plantarum]|uniref:ABC-three component system middle component 6 n=1 Tax=Lactiplantibacillus plantarum TaxID=1590 RepID=UPI000E099924|nr:ABC-three component system middle component 6 [Lactiplantibacillus plantarum]RDG01759.1 hypothetical protein DQM19_06855 [Lactiplantibacillus plantarum]
MILPTDTRPELSLYFLGGIIIQKLEENPDHTITWLDLYEQVKQQQALSHKLFQLTLNWLYLISVVQVNLEGGVVLVHQSA